MVPQHKQVHTHRRHADLINPPRECVDRRPADNILQWTDWRIATPRTPRFSSPPVQFGAESLPPGLLPPASAALMASRQFTFWRLADDEHNSPRHRRP